MEKAVKNSKKGELKPVFEIAYALQPKDKLEVLQTAYEINERLGYELFDDLYYPRLIQDMSTIARAAQLNMLESK